MTFEFVKVMEKSAVLLTDIDFHKVKTFKMFAF